MCFVREKKSCINTSNFGPTLITFSYLYEAFYCNRWKHKSVWQHNNTHCDVSLSSKRPQTPWSYKTLHLPCPWKEDSLGAQTRIVIVYFGSLTLPFPPPHVGLSFKMVTGGRQPKVCIIVLSVWRISSNKDLPARSAFFFTFEVKEGRPQVWESELRILLNNVHSFIFKDPRSCKYLLSIIWFISEPSHFHHRYQEQFEGCDPLWVWFILIHSDQFEGSQRHMFWSITWEKVDGNAKIPKRFYARSSWFLPPLSSYTHKA